MRKLLLAVLGLGAALAQEINPQGIIVNPVPTDLEVQVWVDKDPAKRGNAVYRIGESIYIYVRVNQDAYVYLFNINADGRIDPILPNPYERDNFLRAGRPGVFPGGGPLPLHHHRPRGGGQDPGGGEPPPPLRGGDPGRGAGRGAGPGLGGLGPRPLHRHQAGSRQGLGDGRGPLLRGAGEARRPRRPPSGGLQPRGPRSTWTAGGRAGPP